MALETTSMPLGIRPINRPQTPTGTEGIARREDGSSGFSPRTDLAIKNAIDDMTGILSKIASEQTDTMQKIPVDLQKVVQDIMKNAFSVEETLVKGFGSSLESQRFSLEQLQIFARMLTQLGALADKGFTTDFSEPMQTFFANLKAYVSAQTGSTVEPVLLNKIAFELLDTKSVVDLPPSLQVLLTKMQVPAATLSGSNEAEASLVFLKQLVRAFMPNPANPASTAGAYGGAGNNFAGNFGQNFTGGQGIGSAGGFNANSAAGFTAGVGNPNPADGGAGNFPGQNFGGQNQMAGNTGGTPGGQFTQTATQAGQPGFAAPSGQAPAGVGFSPGESGALTGQNSGGNNASANVVSNSVTTDVPENGLNTSVNRNMQGENVGEFMRPNGGGAALDGAEGSRSSGNAAENLNLNELKNWLTRNAKRTDSKPSAEENLSPLQQAKTQILRQPMQNLPSTMDIMKNLAQLLLRDSQLTAKDTEVLQNFVNGQETVFSERDARQLQTLLRICQQNIPASVQQAAVQQNMPDLPRLWAFMQLCDMSMTKNMSGSQLKRAGKSVGEFTAAVRKSTGGGNSRVQGKRSLNFMLPLFFGDENTSYPSYVHVYDEDALDQITGDWKKETWLRICLLTDNIGAVEMVCRIFDGVQLDVRLFFSNRDTAKDFREYLPELRQNMRGDKLGGKLRLHEIKVGAAGERRFL